MTAVLGVADDKVAAAAGASPGNRNCLNKIQNWNNLIETDLMIKLTKDTTRFWRPWKLINVDAKTIIHVSAEGVMIPNAATDVGEDGKLLYLVKIYICHQPRLD